MVFNTDKIITDVRTCLDENKVMEQIISVADADTIELDDIIRSKITEAVDKVHSQAPYYMLELGHLFGNGSAVYWHANDTSGHVMLPGDFMRLVVFSMSDWLRPVHEAITPADPRYKVQRGRIKALRGTYERPVCVVDVRQSGKVLEFYSCQSTDASVSNAVYIPYSSIDNNGGVDISERCYTSVVNTIAALTLISCGEAERGSAMLDMAIKNLVQ